LFHKIWQGTTSRFLFRPLGLLWGKFSRLTMCLLGRWRRRRFWCHNPSLGLMTKAKACKDAGQEWTLGVTFYPPKSVRKCEGMNPHIPKWAFTLGVGVLMDSQIFRGLLQGSKLIGLKILLYHWEAFRT
jgi:hypothetical protein